MEYHDNNDVLFYDDDLEQYHLLYLLVIILLILLFNLLYNLIGLINDYELNMLSLNYMSRLREIRLLLRLRLVILGVCFILVLFIYMVRIDNLEIACLKTQQ